MSWKTRSLLERAFAWVEEFLSETADSLPDGGTRNVKNLYVIKLSDEVLRRPKFIKENPRYETGKPCVYVGVTAHDPRYRYEQHLDGGKTASKWVRDFGRDLMEEEYEHRNPIPAAGAERQEKELARALRARGWGVWQR